MGKIWDKALAFVLERLPELVGDFFGPWLKWIVIISKFIIELCIEAELLAMAGSLLCSLLFLFLLFLAVECIDRGRGPAKLYLWAASVACIVAPFWLGLCGSLILVWVGFSDQAKFKDPAVNWCIVFATHRSGLASAAIPATSRIGEMLYISSPLRFTASLCSFSLAPSLMAKQAKKKPCLSCGWRSSFASLPHLGSHGGHPFAFWLDFQTPSSKI